MHKQATVIRVGISDLNIALAPNKIRTTGLGSCVGVVIYDQQRKIAGLAHVMLPDSNLTKEKNYNIYKYANTAIPYLVNLLKKNGARSFALKAKIAGGAQMFKLSADSNVMRIGPRNVEAVEKALQQINIPIVAKDVGGNSGRTIEFDPETGCLNVRTVNLGEKCI
ncbi:MAG TPA: chemotaxis protein CheD [Bacillota bacterium]|nr:chemotaxis protein CheD [Bacillota bacterium]